MRGGENVVGDYAIVGYDGGTLYYDGYWTGGTLPTSAADHTATIYSRFNSTSDIQLVIDANNQKNVYMTTSSYKTQVSNGVTSAVVRDSTGWWLEVCIQKSALDPDIPATGTFGVDFGFRDNDSGETSSQYAWADNASGDSFPTKVPNSWGDCVD